MIRAVATADGAGRGTEISFDGVPVLSATEPVVIVLMGGHPVAAGYDSVSEGDGSVTGVATVELPDGAVMAVQDRWQQSDAATVMLVRTARVVRPGTSAGFRLELRARTTQGHPGDAHNWQLLVPGAVYGRNDSDHDGREDYFGRYILDYRDDRVASLAVMAYLPSSSTYVSLGRAGAPTFDSPVAREDLGRPEVLLETDIGSLGLVLGTDGSDQVLLRASYPFSEEITFALDWKGTGWAGFRPVVQDSTFSVSYEIHVGRAPSMTDAIWDLTKHRMEVLRPDPGKVPFSMEDSLGYRMGLVQQYYREWDKAEDDKEPAGYGVHFSPRSGRTLGRLLEYGYSGAQPLLAHMSIRYGYLRGEALPVLRARRVLDFFVKYCQRDNGFAYSIYDVTKHDFVYWFSGILLPFQYSADPAALRRHVGSQIL